MSAAQEEAKEGDHGFALVARFVYPSPVDTDHVVRVDQYELEPGQGLLFIGEGDTPEEPIRFEQSQATDVLQSTDLSKLQLIAALEMKTGALMFSDGTEGNSIAVDATFGESLPVITVKYGRMLFAGIWGKDRESAFNTLTVLQNIRGRMN